MRRAVATTSLLSLCILLTLMYWEALEMLIAATVRPATSRTGAAMHRICSSFSSRSKA